MDELLDLLEELRARSLRVAGHLGGFVRRETRRELGAVVTFGRGELAGLVDRTVTFVDELLGLLALGRGAGPGRTGTGPPAHGGSGGAPKRTPGSGRGASDPATG